MGIDKRLEALRKAAGLTQAELAIATGSAQSTISQIEAGARRPSYEMLRGIASALNVNVTYLLSEEVEGLSPEEEEHFRKYRSLSPEAREDLRSYVAFLQQRHKAPRGSKP